MDDMFFSYPIDNRRSICISPISSCLLRDSGHTNIGDDFGYFIYVTDAEASAEDCTIVAKAANLDGALLMAELARRASERPA